LNPDRYALRRRASFDDNIASSFGLPADNTSASRQVIEHLVDVSDGNSTHSFDEKERTLPRQGFRVPISPGQSLVVPAIN